MCVALHPVNDHLDALAETWHLLLCALTHDIYSRSNSVKLRYMIVFVETWVARLGGKGFIIPMDESYSEAES
jgi:hypothetical protein